MTEPDQKPADRTGPTHVGPVLRVVGLGMSYDSVVALEDVSFDISAGEVVAILGPSGSGKTTLLRVIAGLESTTIGSISLVGIDITHAKVQDRKIGIMFQSYALFPHLTVQQNVKFGIKAAKLPEYVQRERYESVMNLVRLDTAQYGDRLPRELSGGQQQRVALARALVTQPRILLLDEPFSNLDAKVREGMRLELLSELKEAGVTTLLVTHDHMDAAYMSDRVVVLDGGKIIQVAPFPDLYATPGSPFVGDFIGESNWIRECTIESVDAASRTAVVGVPGIGSWRARLGGETLPKPGKAADFSLMVRREAIAELRPSGTTDGAEGANLFTGAVRDVVDLGLTRVVWLKLNESGAAMPFNMRTSAIKVTGALEGAAVTGVVDPAMCSVFPADVVPKGVA